MRGEGVGAKGEAFQQMAGSRAADAQHAHRIAVAEQGVEDEADGDENGENRRKGRGERRDGRGR